MCDLHRLGQVCDLNSADKDSKANDSKNSVIVSVQV